MMQDELGVPKKADAAPQMAGIQCPDDVLTDNQERPPQLTVLYDGACPLCSREIAFYKGMKPVTPLCFADVSKPAQALPPGASRAQMLARFHVIDIDGQLLSGARAFVALWATLPGWRWLARMGRLPGALWVMERSYRLFLYGRPTLQRWFSRLDRTDRLHK
jgi:predicted DCC family thiol-disulfide oxidoreductase YuxK